MQRSVFEGKDLGFTEIQSNIGKLGKGGAQGPTGALSVIVWHYRSIAQLFAFGKTFAQKDKTNFAERVKKGSKGSQRAKLKVQDEAAVEV